MSWVLSPISASATTAKELQRAVIPTMIPRPWRPGSSLGRDEARGQVADVLEAVPPVDDLHDLAGAGLAQGTARERVELGHHLVVCDRIGRVATDDICAAREHAVI